MKKTGLLLCLLVVVALTFGCGLGERKIPQVPRCDDYGVKGDKLHISQVYQRTDPGACLVFWPPSDQSGWFESEYNSRRLRGEPVINLGCTHCPADNRDCGAADNCGGCITAHFSLDFSKFQEDAEIKVAYLAVYVLSNQENLKRSILEGRLNIGSDYAVVSGPPVFVGDWALYDITAFACRSVVERRNSANLELSLPCGPEARSKLATLKMAEATEPTLILEYR